MKLKKRIYVFYEGQFILETKLLHDIK